MAALAGVSFAARLKESVRAVMRSAALAAVVGAGGGTAFGAGAGFGEGTDAPLDSACIYDIWSCCVLTIRVSWRSCSRSISISSGGPGRFVLKDRVVLGVSGGVLTMIDHLM